MQGYIKRVKKFVENNPLYSEFGFRIFVKDNCYMLVNKFDDLNSDLNGKFGYIGSLSQKGQDELFEETKKQIQIEVEFFIAKTEERCSNLNREGITPTPLYLLPEIEEEIDRIRAKYNYKLLRNEEL